MSGRPAGAGGAFSPHRKQSLAGPAAAAVVASALFIHRGSPLSLRPPSAAKHARYAVVYGSLAARAKRAPALRTQPLLVRIAKTCPALPFGTRSD